MCSVGVGRVWGVLGECVRGAGRAHTQDAHVLLVPAVVLRERERESERERKREKEKE